MKTYAYWRVSASDQNEARQLKAFRECGEKINRVYGDKQSGKDLERPGYKNMLEKLEPGDLVIIKSLDRLSRKYDDIASAWNYITNEKGADIVVLDMKDILDTRLEGGLMKQVICDIVVRLLSYVSETERENIRKRQREGINAMSVDENGRRISKKTGRGFGREKKCPENFREVYERQQRGEITLKEALAEVGVGRTRWYELAREVA